MLSVKLIAVGKLKEAYWLAAAAEYEKRLKTMCKLSTVEISEERLPDAPSAAEISAALSAEGERIKKHVSGTVLPLCVEGDSVSSQELAGKIEKCMLFPGALSFIIGSSHGLCPEIKALGRGISLSRMTLPHQLARVVVLEQIYRGFQILANSRYHK